MLTSIHPLGERARNQNYRVTLSWYLLGSLLGGILMGGTGGAIGSQLPMGEWRLAAAVFVGLTGATLDLLGRRPPSVHRQVDENWLGRYRGWVYGLGFGFQLGTGVATIVTTAAVYTTVAMTVLVGSIPVGSLIGGAFGLARGMVILSARHAGEHEILRSLMRRVQSGLPRATAAVVAVQAMVAVVALVAVL